MMYLRTSILGGMLLAAVTCGPALAQSAAHVSTLQAAPSADMDMPDDLGAPLPGAAPEPTLTERTLSVRSPIALIAGCAGGRAVLDRDLPGLRERPEFMMFKGMSPQKLAAMSGGRISDSDLEKLQADLIKVSTTDLPRRHSLFTQSGQTVGRFSKAVVHHVAVMIAAL